MRAARGFTLVELMVAMGVAIGLLMAIYMVVNSTQRHSTSIERKVTVQQDVKPALDIMALEIGMASYNPTFATNLWVTPTGNCTTAAANQTYRGIQEATANSIVVEMDISGAGSTPDDGDGTLTGANEIIRYNYDTTNRYITRRTNSGGTCGIESAFLGETTAGKKTVRVINNTLGIPVFRYYDGAGTEIVEGTTTNDLPARIPDIRRIEIVLAVDTEYADSNTGVRRQLIYSTSVIPRNHAIQ